jgi:hypothetical protein
MNHFKRLITFTSDYIKRLLLLGILTWFNFSEALGIVVEEEVLEHAVPRIGLEELELDKDFFLLFTFFANLVLFLWCLFLFNFCGNKLINLRVVVS